MFKTKIQMISERKGERLGSFYKKNNTEKDLGFKTTINVKEYIKFFIKNH